MTTTTDRLAIDGGTPVSSAPIPFMALGLDPADIAAANEVLESGMLRSASKCAALEEKFADASDARFGLTCANGTCALQLAYEALLEPGDEVICPAWTYIATASMLAARGCRVVFCDSLEDSYQIDPRDLERRITRRTMAIAATHIYGIPVDIDAIEDIARRYNLRVIYDCAQAHLATYKGRGLGAYGDVCTYSFYATKNLGTGEGGMVTVNDEALRDEIALIRSHGESDKYLHVRVGYNYRMNDITGAIGLSKLGRLHAETERRREVAKLYHRLFDERIAGGLPIGRPEPTHGSEPAWHLYSIRLDLTRVSCDRDRFAEALRAENVPCAVHYPKSLTDQPAFAEIVRRNARSQAHLFDSREDAAHPPVARSLAGRVLSIPIHHNLSDEQAQLVVEAVARVATAFAK